MRDLYRLVLLGFMLLYVWVFGGLAIAQHQGMRTHKADLGQIDQAVWNSSRGRFLEMTDFGFIATRMTDHVEPVLVFISPIYWLWDDTRAILILQVLFVAAGAWILYHLAFHQFMETLPPADRDKPWHTDTLSGLARPIALSLAVAYLLTPSLQSAVLTEFHAVPLVVPMVLWAFWAVATRRWLQFAVAVFLVATVKEETALLAAGLGVWALWRVGVAERFFSQVHHRADRAHPTGNGRDKPRPSGEWQPLLLAGALTVASLIWFYVATFVIVPAHAAPVYGIAESGYFQRYGALGDSPADILRSFFTRPGLVWQIATEPVRVEYLYRLLMPYGFLSLLAPDLLLLSLPVLLANQLSAYPAQYYAEYHYSAPVVVYFAAAAAFGAARLWRWLAAPLARASASFQHMPAAPAAVMNLAAFFSNARTALQPLLALLLITWLLAWSLVGYFQFGRGPGAPRLDHTPVTAHHRLLPRFTAQIPPDAAVTATAAVHPHVSHRRFVYQFPMGLDAPTPPKQRATWALLNITMAIDMAPGDLRARVESMLAGDWRVADAADGFLLLHKDTPESVLASAQAEAQTILPEFYSFARVSRANAQQPAAPLTLLATEILDRPYWRSTQIMTRWQAGEGFDAAAMSPQAQLRTPAGETLYADANATAPALVWLPPHTWQPGETVQISTLPLYLPASWGVIGIDSQGEQLTAAYYRGRHDRLHALPTGPQTGTAHQIAAPLGLEQAPPVRFSMPETTDAQADAPEARSREIRLTPWVPAQAWPGEIIDIFLEWDAAGPWPDDLSVFVHLRAGDENRAQHDGKPRYFLETDASETGIHWDWRQLPLPADASAELSWLLVVGLYNPTTGQRAILSDEAGNHLGDELHLTTLRLVKPPLPDQTCALIPDTCPAQSE